MTGTCVLSPDMLSEDRDGKSMSPHQTDRRVIFCSKKSSSAWDTHGMGPFKSILAILSFSFSDASVEAKMEVVVHVLLAAFVFFSVSP